jgi:hypothetical protein
VWVSLTAVQHLQRNKSRISLTQALQALKIPDPRQILDTRPTLEEGLGPCCTGGDMVQRQSEVVGMASFTPSIPSTSPRSSTAPGRGSLRKRMLRLKGGTLQLGCDRLAIGVGIEGLQCGSGWQRTIYVCTYKQSTRHGKECDPGFPGIARQRMQSKRLCIHWNGSMPYPMLPQRTTIIPFRSHAVGPTMQTDFSKKRDSRHGTERQKT